MRQKWSTLAVEIFLLGICVIVIFGILAVLYPLSNTLDPQGGNSDGCVSEPLASVPGGRGMLVSGHRTLCDNFFYDSAVYVYLHKMNEIESPAALFLRYEDDPTLDTPKVHWIGESKIGVSVGEVVQVTKILPSIDGIGIEYAIGRERYPRQAWLDETNRLKQIEMLLVILLCLLLYASKHLLASIWRGARKPKAPEQAAARDS